MDRVLPPHLKRKPSDTTVATEMGRCLAVKGKTTRESAGNTRPSKHELTYGIRYRHIQIHAPPPPRPIPGDRAFNDPVEERCRKMYHTLHVALSDCEPSCLAFS